MFSGEDSIVCDKVGISQALRKMCLQILRFLLCGSLLSKIFLFNFQHPKLHPLIHYIRKEAAFCLSSSNSRRAAGAMQLGRLRYDPQKHGSRPGTLSSFSSHIPYVFCLVFAPSLLTPLLFSTCCWPSNNKLFILLSLRMLSVEGLIYQSYSDISTGTSLVPILDSATRVSIL